MPPTTAHSKQPGLGLPAPVPSRSADTSPTLLRHLLFHSRGPGCNTRSDIPSANEMRSSDRSRFAAAPAESSLPPTSYCRSAACQTRRRSTRKRTHAPPATLAAWRCCRPDGTHHLTPYCASQRTAADTLRHPVSPLPQNNPPGLPGPSHSSAARTLSGHRAPVLACVAVRIAAPPAPRSDAPDALRAAASRSGAPCDAACAAPAGRLPASRRCALSLEPVSAVRVRASFSQAESSCRWLG